MSPEIGIFIMLNNYFHDVATALLVASGIIIWIIIKWYDSSAKTRETTEYFLRIYKSSTKLAKISLAWILIGGIPRTLAYRDFEWTNAVGKGQVPALIIKHILAFIIVGTGIYIWIKLNKRVKKIKSDYLK